MWLEAIFGIKINLEKSELILVGRVPIMEELVDILGCKVGSLPSKYLGLPLGATFKLTTMRDFGESGWKESSQGGRNKACPRGWGV